MEDEAVVAAVQRGDHDAFSILVDRYQDRLYTTALRLLGSPSDAADVVQDTFVRAFTHIHDIRGATVRAWLYRVTTNCVRDVQRRHMRRATVSIDVEDNVIDLPDPSLGPERSALSREEALAIGAAIAELPTEFAEVVIMRDINDLSYDEISAALSCPVGTVKSRLSRGRAQLVSRLRDSSTGLFTQSEEQS
jgi:RNA polymerase sigma-70 factor (ECF subfamily)